MCFALFWYTVDLLSKYFKLCVLFKTGVVGKLLLLPVTTAHCCFIRIALILHLLPYLQAGGCVQTTQNNI